MIRSRRLDYGSNPPPQERKSVNSKPRTLVSINYTYQVTTAELAIEHEV